ncbi:4-coumarate--CoA ligase 1-like [Pieris brassicae]|uniref:4-coumarate--CoA ligase 1-like n=1 Tax=Pieris brassicae TaxID=7116 RepID=UPI001E660D7C|nr:4-coumarate--CoA ligase 1-like [Pieris brassicae]
MLKSNNYIYGGDDGVVPSHIHFGTFMLFRAKHYDTKIAMIDADTDKRMTFNEFAQLSVNIALSLKKLGVGVGDVVCVCSEKRMEFMPTIVGVCCTGASFAAGDNSVKNDAFLYRLKILKPKVLFISQASYEIHKHTLSTMNTEHIVIYGKGPEKTFEEFLSESADVEEFEATPVKGTKDIAVIQFSSGTTGLPKAAKLTHFNFIHAITQSERKYQGFDVNNKYAGSMSLATREWYYTYGLFHTIITLSVGSCVVFTREYIVEDFLRAIQQYKIKYLQIVPNSLMDIKNCVNCHKYDLSSVEHIYSASLPIGKDLISGVNINFPNVKEIKQSYGMTESGCVIHEEIPNGDKLGTVGTACVGTVIKVVDIKTDEALGPNRRGEIRFKSLSLMAGYVGELDRDYLDEEGFYKTGDVGYYDEDKYFYIVDRLKHLLKYKGATISPAEVEMALIKHPGLKDVGVTSHPFSEAPVVFAVIQPGCDVTLQEINDILHVEIPSASLSEIRFVEAIPRGVGTKIDRHALKNMLK